MSAPAPPLPRLRFDTDFQAALPFTLRPVPSVDDISRSAFRRDFQLPGHPVILKREMQGWAAIERWKEPSRLIALTGPERVVYCRQRSDPGRPYTEEYVALKFRQLIAEIFDAPYTSHYLTQGLIYRAQGFNRLLARLRFPAFLEELSEDCVLPSVIDSSLLHQGILWMGSGGQITPLHFDEQENLNGMVQGRKRWLLFPSSEALNLLLPEHDGRGSVLSSLEMLTADGRWHGGPVKDAFYCETAPGQMLYVPAGYLHQVYSSSEPNIAVNFWYIDPNNVRLAARALRARSTRRFGFRQPLKRAVQVALMLAALAPLRASYAFKRGVVPEPAYELGPTGYESTVKGV
jgi:hypothetical protein